MPLMSADLVIASEDTRVRFAAARTYPLHFRKTYYPGRRTAIRSTSSIAKAKPRR